MLPEAYPFGLIPRLQLLPTAGIPQATTQSELKVSLGTREPTLHFAQQTKTALNPANPNILPKHHQHRDTEQSLRDYK